MITVYANSMTSSIIKFQLLLLLKKVQKAFWLLRFVDLDLDFDLDLVRTIKVESA